MKMIHFAIALSMVSALSLGISGIVMAAEPDYTFTTGEIKAGQGCNIHTYDLPAKRGTGIYAYENHGNQPCDLPLKQADGRDKRVVSA